MTVIKPNWSRYLASVCKEYAHWWDKYTLTDVTGQRQTKESKGHGFLLDLMAETIPEEEKNKSPDSQSEAKQAEQVERFTVLEGLRKYAKTHVLLRGDPGSGKSTAMARMLLEEVEKVRASQFPNVMMAGNARVAIGSTTVVDRKPLEIPVLVELRYYDKSLQGLIEEAFQRHDPAIDISELEQWLEQGQLLLLLDGLNELPSEAARRDVLRFRRRYEKTTSMVFTTRKLSEGGDLGISTKLTMQPLSEAQMREFVQAYLPGQGEAMLTQLGHRLREFGEVPLLLWMLCSVYACNQQQIPTNLGGVFRQFTRLYDEKLKQDVPDPNRSKLFWQDLLQVLAFQMVVGRKDKEALVAVSRREAEEAIRSFYQESKVGDSLEQARLCIEDLLKYHLIQIGVTDSIQFRHQLIQEYYAAEALLDKLATLSDEELKWKYLNYLKWAEPVALMAGLVSEKTQALRLVNLALETNYESGARLAGAIRKEWQGEAVALVASLEISLPLRTYLLSITESTLTVSELLCALKDSDHNVQLNAADALGRISDTAAVSGLLSAFKSGDWELRSSAANALVNIGDTATVSGLLLALKVEDQNVQSDAASALGRIGDTAAVSGLLSAFKSGDRELRSSAANALVNIGDTAAISGLLDALNDEDGAIRSSAVNALGRIGNATVVSGLLDALNDENRTIRSSAADILGEIGDTVAVNVLLRAALDDKESVVRRKAVEALGKIGDAVAINGLLQALNDKELVVRSSATAALGEIGDAVAINGLLQALNDEAPVVRSGAAAALGKIGDAVAINGLLQALNDEDWFVRRQAVKGLGKIGNSALDALLYALEDKDSFVRSSAVEALVGIGESAVDKLLHALENKNPFVRSNAANALGKIGDTTASSGLLQAFNDEDWDVRRRAAEALLQIGDVPTDSFSEAFNDEDWSVRRRALDALEKAGTVPPTDLLVQALKDRDWGVRVRAAGLLEKICDTMDTDVLVKALKDEEYTVRIRIADSLEKICNTMDTDVLVKALKDEKDSYVREVVANVLGQIGDSVALPELLSAFKNGDLRVRYRAAEALGKIGDATAVSELVSALNDKEEGVRYKAAEALGEIDDATAVSGLVSALNDKSSSVCRSAANALGKIGDATVVSRLTEALCATSYNHLRILDALRQAQAKFGYFRPPINMIQSTPSSTQTKILILAANPKSTTRLRLDQEIRDISAGLQRARHRDKFTLVQKWAVRSRDFQRAMLEERPQIVHFSGHGEGESGLYFENNQGYPHLITGESISNLFQLFAHRAQTQAPIICVLLNGCYSAVQAKEIAKHVPFVIGMGQAIGDNAAIEFAVGFYDALGNGESVEFSFDFAKAAMGLSETGSKHIPILIKKETTDY